MKTKRKGGLLMALGIVLVLAAAGLAVYNVESDNAAARSSNQALEALLSDMPSVRPSRLDEILASQSSETPDEYEIPDHKLNPAMDMPEKTVYGWKYIGVLDIPALELSLPIMSQWSYTGLYYAPARYTGSAYTDDLVIAGHNFSSHFGNLKNLPEGSEVIFTDVDGNRFDYQSVLIETLEPTAVEEMCSGPWDLSLFTCTVGGQYRVTIRCERIEYDWLRE